MDDLTAELFGNPTVTVGGYESEAVHAACHAVFGRLLTAEELARFIAAPDASVLVVEAWPNADDLELHLGYEWFDGMHDYLVYIESESGKRIVEFQNVAVLADAPDLLETRLFARQVRSFREFAIDEIRLWAAGFAGDPSGSVGYYVWARFGFVLYLDGYGPQLAAAGFAHVDNTLDLFSQSNGSEWWYNHGSERPAVFYLRDGSPCLVALEAYLEERGVDAND